MASELNHHVGYSRENKCWFVRFYPYQTEQQALDAVMAFTRPAPATDIEDLLRKTVAAFNALSPEQQAEMLEEQRQSWVRGNVGLSRDERGMTSPVMHCPAPAVTDPVLEMAQRILDMRDGKAPPLFPRVEGPHSVTIRYGVWEDDLFALATAALQNNTRPTPAATDTGLETVEYQFKPGGNDYWTNTTAHNFPGYKVKGWQTRELVDRSQVEVLIAHLQKELSCRDALIKDHLGKILHLENRVDEEALRADQADELLAAERAKTERWHKKAMDAGVIVHSDGTTSHPMRKERDDLKADNAAKDARIKELETERTMIVSHATMGQTDGIGLTVNDISVRVSALRNELYEEGRKQAEALGAQIKALDHENNCWMKSAIKQQKRSKALEAKLAAAEQAARSVEEWWLSEGIKHFDGAPYCIFATRAVLGGKPS